MSKCFKNTVVVLFMSAAAALAQGPQQESPPSPRVAAFFAPAALSPSNPALWMYGALAAPEQDHKALGLAAAQRIDALGLARLKLPTADPLSEAQLAQLRVPVAAIADGLERFSLTNADLWSAVRALALSDPQQQQLQQHLQARRHLLARIDEAIALPNWQDLPLRDPLMAGVDRALAEPQLLRLSLAQAALDLQQGNAAQGLERLERVSVHLTRRVSNASLPSITVSQLHSLVSHAHALTAAWVAANPTRVAAHAQALEAALAPWPAQLLSAAATQGGETATGAHYLQSAKKTMSAAAKKALRLPAAPAAEVAEEARLEAAMRRTAVGPVIEQSLALDDAIAAYPLAQWSDAAAFLAWLPTQAAPANARATAHMAKDVAERLGNDGQLRSLFAQRLAHLHNARRAVLAQARLLAQAVPPDQRQTWLNAAPPELRDPIDGQPYVYNAERKQLLIKVRAQLGSSDLFPIQLP